MTITTPLSLGVVPFNHPQLEGAELRYISETLAIMHISGDGTFTKRCRTLLEESLGVMAALLTTSCTHALEMAALLLDLQPGDEVLVPSFTFVSSANAFVLHGARPVFVDIRPDTLNIDECLVEQKITARTKAIVVVHYAGVAAEMEKLTDLAHKHSLVIVEDNAHGLYGKYKGRFLGRFGAMATLSFHETKNFTCGEGGALLLNDPDRVGRAEIIREKGTNRNQFFRGQVDKYTWVDVGSSYLPSDLLAAYLYAQLERRDMIQERRSQIWHYYDQHLTTWAAECNVQLPYVPAHCEQAYHMYYLIMPSLAHRQAMIRHLSMCKVNSVFHYLPLHLSPMGQRFGGKVGECPVAERVSDCLLRLPFFNGLTTAQQDQVIESVQAFDFSAASIDLHGGS
ncbi:MAG: dTDP-4-amino-4,6-dideoxygalactose transaminase [Chloroflexota bacterium]